MHNPYMKKGILFFAIISVGYLVVFFQRVAPAIVGPVLIENLGLAAADIGMMASMYFWAQAMGCLPAGLLSDRFGPRKIIALGLAFSAIGTVIFALADDLFLLALGRFCIGLGVSVVFVGAMKIFTDWFQPNQLATCSGVLLAVGNVGALMATAPLMFLISVAGWREAFIAIAAYTLVAAILAWAVLRNKPQDCDLAPLSRDKGNSHIGMKEALHAVFSSRNFYFVTIAATLYYGTLMNVGGLWSGPWLQDVYALGKSEASFIVMFFTLGMIVGCPLSGWLSDKILRSRKKVLFLGSVMNATVYVPLFFAFTELSAGSLVILFFLFGVTGGFFVSCFACVKETAENKYAATAIGALNMGIAAGAGFFQYICGVVIGMHEKLNGTYSSSAYRQAFLICFAALILSGIIMLFYKEKGYVSKNDSHISESKQNGARILSVN